MGRASSRLAAVLLAVLPWVAAVTAAAATDGTDRASSPGLALADLDRGALIVGGAVVLFLIGALGIMASRGRRQLLLAQWMRMAGSAAAVVYICGTELFRIGSDVGYWRIYAGNVAIVAWTIGYGRQLGNLHDGDHPSEVRTIVVPHTPRRLLAGPSWIRTAVVALAVAMVCCGAEGLWNAAYMKHGLQQMARKFCDQARLDTQFPPYPKGSQPTTAYGHAVQVYLDDRVKTARAQYQSLGCGTQSPRTPNR